MNTQPLIKLTYIISPIWRRIVGRVIDIILVSLVPLGLSLGFYLSDVGTATSVWKPIVINVVNVVMLLIYFVFIPYFSNGRTLGKLITNIRLIAADRAHVTLKMLFWRELMVVFFPWITLVAVSFGLQAAYGLNFFAPSAAAGDYKIANIIMRALLAFFLAWYLGMIIVEKIDPKHQLYFDRKYNGYVVLRQPIKQPAKSELTVKAIYQPEAKHVHLGRTHPGVITDEALHDLEELNYDHD